MYYMYGYMYQAEIMTWALSILLDVYLETPISNRGLSGSLPYIPDAKIEDLTRVVISAFGEFHKFHMK